MNYHPRIGSTTGLATLPGEAGEIPWFAILLLIAAAF